MKNSQIKLKTQGLNELSISIMKKASLHVRKKVTSSLNLKLHLYERSGHIYPVTIKVKTAKFKGSKSLK